MVVQTSSQASRKAKDECQVLIIGAGPSGLLQAYLLAKFGVGSILVEKYPERLSAPKAHALSPRSLEISRQFFLDTNCIRSKGSPRKDAFWVNFALRLGGEHIGRLPYERMDDAIFNATPEMLHNIPQPDFEQILLAELAQMEDLVEIRKPVSFVSLSQDSTRVITIVEDCGTGKLYPISSRFVVACDGSKSSVREHLGIESVGEDAYETMMTIHFHADLRPVVKSRVGILHWLMDPRAAGVVIAYDLSGNQVMLHTFDPEKEPIETWSESSCLQLLKAAIGIDIPLKVRSWRPWVLNRKVAKTYRASNVFLAGDAAHSFPPTGGLGLNTGIADVHNLAFKLAAVLQGWADESVLEKYETERRPVAEVNSAQSLKNGKQILSLLKSLGTISEPDLNQAGINLNKALNDKTRRQKIEEEIAAQQEHFNNLQLHIGYVYGNKEVPSDASLYFPKYVSGARLPHAWIRIWNANLVKCMRPLDLRYVSEFGEKEIEERRWSTLDLCAFDCLTLIQSQSKRSIARAARIVELMESDNVLTLVDKNKTFIRIVTVGIDFEVVPSQEANNFQEGLNMTTNGAGAILVNPDQHILSVITVAMSAEQVIAVAKRYFFQSW